MPVYVIGKFRTLLEWADKPLSKKWTDANNLNSYREQHVSY